MNSDTNTVALCSLPDNTVQHCQEVFGYDPKPAQLRVVDKIGKREDCVLIAGISSINLKGGMKIPFDDLVKGVFRAVFMSPEIALQSPVGLWIQPEWRKRLRAVVVDEAHCVGAWGLEFRKQYGLLRQLRSKIARTTYFLAISATLPPALLSAVISTLYFKNIEVVNIGNGRTNVKYNVAFQRFKETTFGDLRFLKDGVKTIVYFQSINDAEAASRRLRRFMDANRVAVYYPMMSDELKVRRMNDFKVNHTCVLLSTEAAGMGCDISDVVRVVQYGYPNNISTLVQRLGQAARDSHISGSGILLVPRRDIHSIEPALKKYVTSTTCRRRYLNSYFNNQHQDVGNCCDICNPDLIVETGIAEASKIRKDRPPPRTGAEKARALEVIKTWRRDAFNLFYRNRCMLLGAGSVMSDSVMDKLATSSAAVVKITSLPEVIRWEPLRPIIARCSASGSWS
ncbi:P-loop containing nucleoside triphosphate hydrolase protein [Gamsiella multidivaricata]|uniref:P-loop containing nucleoside triphosphate hydrolase protein n=1 Tax=Gamsiella multidivaricata TaxID=101098 RepID=UPI0022201973|nr:P-loop containing nucleoside triphosphate hydrolase protein [Gamsiella multidivaricata]KAI7830701.1 P-loop containing nucleoside triphosphate hydrolase protein [Gamsiella multidivaricata]